MQMYINLDELISNLNVLRDELGTGDVDVHVVDCENMFHGIYVAKAKDGFVKMYI